MPVRLGAAADLQYGYRVVEPWEALPGSVETEFLPENPPERRYSWRDVQ